LRNFDRNLRADEENLTEEAIEERKLECRHRIDVEERKLLILDHLQAEFIPDSRHHNLELVANNYKAHYKKE